MKFLLSLLLVLGISNSWANGPVIYKEQQRQRKEIKKQKQQKQPERKRAETMGGAPNMGAGMGTGTGAGSTVGPETGKGKINSGPTTGEETEE